MGYLGNQITTVFPTSISVDSATIKGDTTIGDASAADKKILFDGNAQDFHIGLDDSSDSLTIGLGSALGTTSHIVIDANGQITKPLQPAFLATKTSNANNFTTGSQQDITFTTEVYDQNADFASSIFTAPVTGKYYLKSSIYLSGVDTAVDYYSIRITTSNRVYIKIFTPKFTADVDYMSMEVSTVADMDASDTAKIQIVQSSGATQTDIQGNAAYTYFTGFLAC